MAFSRGFHRPHSPRTIPVPSAAAVQRALAATVDPHRRHGNNVTKTTEQYPSTIEFRPMRALDRIGHEPFPVPHGTDEGVAQALAPQILRV